MVRIEVRQKAKINNQVPHLTQDTEWEGDKTHTKKHHIQESEEDKLFPIGDHKAARNRHDRHSSMTKTNTNK